MEKISLEKVCDIMGMTKEEFEKSLKKNNRSGRIEFRKFLGEEGNMRKYAEVVNSFIDVRMELVYGCYLEGVEYIGYYREDKGPIFSIYYVGGPCNSDEYNSETYEIVW